MNKDTIDFLKDIKDHEMEVMHDDGIYRHITFGRPGSSVYRFNLTTVPGYLMMTGDMGSWTFSRLKDMFEFFNTDTEIGHISRDYWLEKLQRFGYAKECIAYEFDEEAATSAIGENENQDLIDDWDNSDKTEHDYYNLTSLHDDDGDLASTSWTKRTHHANWAVLAIQWGVQQYYKAHVVDSE